VNGMPHLASHARCGIPRRGPGPPSAITTPSGRSCVMRPNWDEVVTGLGYGHLRRHDLRHTGLTRMADAGVPVHVLRKIAGHGSLVTTQRYLHPDSQSIAAAGAALSAHLTAMTAGWSQSGPKLRLVPGTAGQPSTREDAR